MSKNLASADPTDLVTLSQQLKESDENNQLKPIKMKYISIGSQLINNICKVIEEFSNVKNILIVTDATSISVDSESLKEKVYFLLTKRYSVKWLVLHSSESGQDINADDENAKKISSAINDIDCVIGIGGGTITDLCKYSVYNSDLCIPLVIIQTMLSVNAFSDDVSVMIKQGVKRTIHTMYPTALIVDMDIVSQAPVERNLSGYGDLLATWTAPADWFLANEIGMNSYFHAAPIDIVQTQSYELFEASDKLANRDSSSLELLARVLTLSGLSMGIAGESSPASGTEHIITHLIDMSVKSKNIPVAYHGAQVAVGSILTSIAWDIFLKEFEPNELLIDECFPSHNRMKQKVYDAFSKIDETGETGDECWKEYQLKLTNWHNNKEKFRTLLLNWETFKNNVKRYLQPPKYLCECMHKANAPTHYSQMSPKIDFDTALWAINNCHLYRNRFTLSDLLFYIGWWNDDFITRVLEEAKKMNAGI